MKNLGGRLVLMLMRAGILVCGVVVVELELPLFVAFESKVSGRKYI